MSEIMSNTVSSLGVAQEIYFYQNVHVFHSEIIGKHAVRYSILLDACHAEKRLSPPIYYVIYPNFV